MSSFVKTQHTRGAGVSQSEEIKFLIASTTVLNAAEKQYWMDLLPTMTEGQIEKLKKILHTEQQNFARIDNKYNKKLETIAQNTLTRWDTEKAKMKRLKRYKEEKSQNKEAYEKAERLLENW